MPELTGACRCRKPQPYFLFEAQAEHQVAMADSWLIGDQDTDIFCGQHAGVRTILLNEPRSAAKRGQSRPDYRAADLRAAAQIIREARLMDKVEHVIL